MDLLKRIDDLLAEVTWLQGKFRSSNPFFQKRINARLEAIAVELRALNRLTQGHTVTCWFEVAVS